MSLLVTCHIMIVCYVRVGIVVFTLVPGRWYRVFQCEGWKDIGSYSMDRIALLLYYILWIYAINILSLRLGTFYLHFVKLKTLGKIQLHLAIILLLKAWNLFFHKLDWGELCWCNFRMKSIFITVPKGFCFCFLKKQNKSTKQGSQL